MSPEYLVTDAQVASLRSIAEMGLKDDVTIFKRTRNMNESDPQNAYGDDYETWVEESTTVKGWLFSSPSPVIETVSGRMALVNTYRLFLPVGTDVNSGDRVTINGHNFIVSDLVNESTWLPILRCSLRKAE